MILTLCASLVIFQQKQEVSKCYHIPRLLIKVVKRDFKIFFPLSISFISQALNTLINLTLFFNSEVIHRLKFFPPTNDLFIFYSLNITFSSFH